MTWQSERTAKFQVRNAFFRAESRMVRDLGILAAQVYRHERGSLRILDAMAGSGVRSLRYWTEANADALWVNDSNPDVMAELQDNLAGAIAAQVARITCLNANRLFADCAVQQDYYDFVDVDCFGSAMPYLGSSLRAVAIQGLLYLTSTDIRTVSGHPPGQSVTVYGAYARHHPALHEQGLRIVLGTLQANAAQQGLGVQPLFSLFTGQTFRLLVRVVSKPNLTPDTYGFLGYCHRCGTYAPVAWRELGRSPCPVDHHPPAVSGPLWLGKLHDEAFLHQMAERAQALGWLPAVHLIHLFQQENAFPPYFYTLGEIGRRGACDIPRRSHLIKALQHQGIPATSTHFNPQAIKTAADLPTCIQVVQQLQVRVP